MEEGIEAEPFRPFTNDEFTKELAALMSLCGLHTTLVRVYVKVNVVLNGMGLNILNLKKKCQWGKPKKRY